MAHWLAPIVPLVPVLRTCRQLCATKPILTSFACVFQEDSTAGSFPYVNLSGEARRVTEKPGSYHCLSIFLGRTVEQAIIVCIPASWYYLLAIFLGNADTKAL